MENIDKLFRITIATHSNPTPILQDIYNRLKPWEKPQMKEVAKKFGIELKDKEK